MKICEKHWAAMRKAVEDRGMSHLVAKDNVAAAERLQEELDGTATPKSYDPLMSMHWMVTNKALEIGGLYLLTADDQGNDFCPVCEAIKHTAGVKDLVDGETWDAARTEEHWIDGPADVVLDYCREHKLIQGVQ